MNEAKDAVDRLNGKLLYSVIGEHEYHYHWYLEYVSTPVGDYVKYLGHVIWDSENDCREYVGDDEQEPHEEYFVRQVEKIVEVTMNSLKIMKEKEIKGVLE